MKTCKLTSPIRSSDTMFEKTKEFIDYVSMLMEKKIMNESNIVIFDEIVNGDSSSLPHVITVNRSSAGKNTNVIQTCEKVLGCYVPFSLVDGNTPLYCFRL